MPGIFFEVQFALMQRKDKWQEERFSLLLFLQK